MLRIITDQQPVRRDRLLELSPLGRQDTVDALKSLYSSSRIYLVNVQSYITVKRRKISRETACQRIIKRLFEGYGVMTAECLATLLAHEIPMREIRKILRVLEDEGLLVKGYLLRGSGILHWASIGAFEALGKTEFSDSFVLSPEDNLTQFLRAGFRSLLPETGRLGVFRGRSLSPIGGAQASMKSSVR